MKLLKLFKKGAKAAQGAPAPAGGFEWPDGVRIGLFGHANSGKTVFLTVLNEEAKYSKKLQISVSDQLTASEFLANFRAIWGIGATSDSGTMVDLREDKKFPNPTRGEKVIQFVATLDGYRQVPIVALDYDGKAVGIREAHESKEKVHDFMRGAEGLVFFFDPKAMSAVIQCQEHVASFVNMIEQLAPLSRRLPIPVALVVSKADLLPGFSGDDQVVLIKEDEKILSGTFEQFLERVLSANHIASNSAWAGSVRDVLIKLKEFLKVVVGRTLDLQIFFVSSTGQTPEKIGTDVGRSLYVPPDKMRPVGIQRPLYWLLQAVQRNRRVRSWRRVAKWVAGISCIWLLLFSLPYMHHFWWLKPRFTDVEDRTLGLRERYEIGSEERTLVRQSLQAYERSLTVKWFFRDFQVPLQSIRNQYDSRFQQEASAELDGTISRLAAVVGDPGLWPPLHELADTLILDDTHKSIRAGLEKYHEGDSSSVTFQRAGRALVFWELLQQTWKKRSDTAAWNKIGRQVSTDQQIYTDVLSPGEKKLHEALIGAGAGVEQQQTNREVRREAGDKLKEVTEAIADHANDPAYLLGRAVNDLKALRNTLAGDESRAADVGQIDSYLKAAKYFDRRQTYRWQVDACAPGHHIHVVVKAQGAEENWPREGQIIPNFVQSFKWKKGDHIYVALDRNDHGGSDETFGAKSEIVKKLQGDFAIFDFAGDIQFPGGVTVSISFTDDSDPLNKLPQF